MLISVILFDFVSLNLLFFKEQIAELMPTSSSSLESDVSAVAVAGTSTTNIVIEHAFPEDMELVSVSARAKRK